MKKSLFVTIIIAFIFAVSLPVSAETLSFTAGPNATASLDTETGLMTISGSGSMTDYAGSWSPWYNDIYSSKIKTVVIDSGITGIGKHSFYGCEKLESISIPNTVTGIGEYSFKNCKSLKSVSLPSSVTVIGDGAFCFCDNLTSINIPSGVTCLGSCVFEECGKLTSITIPYGVTEIGNTAFWRCSSLSAVTIPGSVNSIGSKSFAECSGLTSVTIQNGVKKIGGQTFYLCTGISSISIPASLTEIGTYAFEGCFGLKAFSVDGNSNSFSSDSNGVLFSKDKTELVLYPMGAERTSYSIPSGVTQIDKNAFYDCSNLTSITIPNSVTDIMSGAFSSCNNLTSITIPSGVTYIGVEAFAGLKKIKSISLPAGITYIEKNTFSNCSSLSSVTIPSGINGIDVGAFSGCSSLTSINIPAAVNEIGAGAFSGCSNLSSITIPEGVTVVTTALFYDCTGLSSVVIPENVKSIEYGAFYNCSSLASITIPAGVTEIDSGAFERCDNLTIYGYTGSAAEQFANENEINFVVVGTAPQTCKIWYSSNWVPKIVRGYEEFDFSLDDIVFSADSSKYNPKLAHMLMALSCSAYNCNKSAGAPDYNIKDSLAELGFTDFMTKNYYEQYNDSRYPKDGVGFAVGKKTVDDEMIVVIVCRGTTGGLDAWPPAPDWTSNFSIGLSDDYYHYGFNTAATEVFNAVKKYMGGVIPTGGVKYVLTGHSRGAAVANLVSYKLSNAGVDKSNIFDYNFACPDVAKSKNASDWNPDGKFDNMFNVNIAGDPVSEIPGIAGDGVNNIASSVHIAQGKPSTLGATWGKFGKSGWYSLDWSNAWFNFDFHQPVASYLEAFSDESIKWSDFKSWPEMNAIVMGNTSPEKIGKLIGILCPVDVAVYEYGSDELLLTIENNEIAYQNAALNDIMAFVDGDEKYLYIPDNRYVYLELTGTDTGTMNY